MTLRWGEDEDTLAMGMSSGDGGIDAEHAASEKRFKAQGKAETKSSRAQAKAAKGSREAATRAHGVNLAMAVGQSALALGAAGVGKGGPGAKSEALAAKSAGLDVKRQAALKAGNTVRAERLGARSIKLGGRSARLGFKAEFGSARKPLFGKGKPAPVAPAVAPAAVAPTRSPAAQAAWLKHTRGVANKDWTDQAAAAEWASEFSE